MEKLKEALSQLLINILFAPAYMGMMLALFYCLRTFTELNGVYAVKSILCLAFTGIYGLVFIKISSWSINLSYNIKIAKIEQNSQKQLAALSLEASKYTSLKTIKAKGFSVTYSVGGNATTKTYSWRNATSVVLYDNYSKLKVTFKDQSELHLDSSAYSWHTLLRQVPRGFEGYPYSIVRKLSSKYTNCQVCGAIAVFYKTKRCKCCNNKVSDDVTSQQIKALQLKWFAFEQRKSNNISQQFAIYQDWVPQVSAQEIIQYRQSKIKLPQEPQPQKEEPMDDELREYLNK